MFPDFNLKKKFMNINRNYNADLGKTHNFSRDFFTIKNLTEGNQKDQIINNYNVKVNITKKNTKNISIGNLTMNNKSRHELLNLFQSPVSRSISPFKSLNVKKYFDKKFEKNKKRSKSPKIISGLETPRGFDKMINNLKTEFDKIQNKKPMKKKTIKNYKNKYMNRSLNLYQPMTKDFKFFISNKNKIKDHKINNHNYINSNNNIKELPLRISNKIIKRNLSNNKLENTTTCFINNITFDMKNDNEYNMNNKFIESKEISFSFCKNNSSLKKENLQIHLNQKNNLIELLIKFIKIQQKVFCDNIKYFSSKIFKFKDSERNKELKEQIDILIKENKNLKKVSISLFYFLKNDYSLNIEKEKKIKEKISELIKENKYLRSLSQSLDYLNNVNYKNLKFKNKAGEEEDEISHLIKESVLEKTLKEQNVIKNFTVNIKDYSTLIKNTNEKTQNSLDKKDPIENNKKGNNIYKKKRKLNYQKAIKI